MTKNNQTKSLDLNKELPSEETTENINDEDLEKVSGGQIVVVDDEGNITNDPKNVTNGINSTDGGYWA